MKEISLKSNQGPAKRKRHCRKRATRLPRGTDTARALGSPRLPPRAWRTGSPSQAMAGPRLKRHSTPPGRRAPRVCMLLQWTWGEVRRDIGSRPGEPGRAPQDHPPWFQSPPWSWMHLPAWSGRPSAGRTQIPSPRSHWKSCGCSTPRSHSPATPAAPGSSESHPAPPRHLPAGPDLHTAAWRGGGQGRGGWKTSVTCPSALQPQPGQWPGRLTQPLTPTSCCSVFPTETMTGTLSHMLNKAHAIHPMACYLL